MNVLILSGSQQGRKWPRTFIFPHKYFFFHTLSYLLYLDLPFLLHLTLTEIGVLFNWAINAAKRAATLTSSWGSCRVHTNPSSRLGRWPRSWPPATPFLLYSPSWSWDCQDPHNLPTGPLEAHIQYTIFRTLQSITCLENVDLRLSIECNTLYRGHYCTLSGLSVWKWRLSCRQRFSKINALCIIIVLRITTEKCA